MKGTSIICAVSLLSAGIAGPGGAARAEEDRAAQAPRYEETVRESLYVPVRDGTRLAVNIYRPAKDGAAVETPHPVVFVFTPYRARYRDEDGSIVETGLSERLGLKNLTDYGYVVAVADIRGKGASFGARRGFQDRTEARDGYDLVQWLSKRAWSTGNVGMIGCSYLGGTAVQVASTAPPALKAIFAGATDFDKYAFVRRGGITAQFNTRPDEPLSVDLQSVPVDADTDGSQLKAAVAEHADNTPMAPLWYGMPYRDSMSELTNTRFWEEVGPYTYLDTLKKSGIATYFWSNWQDEPTEQVIKAAANLGGKLLIGPGLHCVPPPNFDFAGEIRRFFDHHLKGVDNGINAEPKYTYWIENAPPGKEWVHTDTLPGAGVDRESWYLADARLSPSAGRTATDRLNVDYSVGSDEYFPFWIEPQDEHGLTYTSRPLKANRLMVGYPIIDLRASADGENANFFAYLEDVAPDGEVTMVSFGRLAASHRKISDAPYDMLGLPWHSGRKADMQPLQPGKMVDLRFAMLPSARVFEKGHRLRVTITGADPRQRNLQDIRDGLARHIEVSLGGETPSRIHLPLYPQGAWPN